MATDARNLTAKTDESVPVLRWVFFRGTKVVSCEVRATGTHLFDVCIVPHWDVASSVIEPFDCPGSALQRHAEISSHFRGAGWILTRQTN
jgi:hypothetical protein